MNNKETCVQMLERHERERMEQKENCQHEHFYETIFGDMYCDHCNEYVGRVIV